MWCVTRSVAEAGNRWLSVTGRAWPAIDMAEWTAANCIREACSAFCRWRVCELVANWSRRRISGSVCSPALGHSRFHGFALKDVSFPQRTAISRCRPWVSRTTSA